MMAVELRKKRAGNSGFLNCGRPDRTEDGSISVWTGWLRTDYYSSSPMPKLVNPLPQALPKECAKAANICV